MPPLSFAMLCTISACSITLAAEPWNSKNTVGVTR